MNKLALYGGRPIRDTYLEYGKQSIGVADIQAVVEVLAGDYLTTGPKVKFFEEQVAAYVGAKYAVAAANGTAALHMSCFAAGIQPGDEVIVSPITFAASANCVLYCGGRPVFADIDPITYNIDPKEIEKKITGKTKAIIPVDYAGQSVDMDRIMDIAARHHLTVIEDAAHALGSEYKGRKVGSQANLTVFSFHPVKPVTTGEGGLVTTNDEALYQRMLQFRTHGITRDGNKLLHKAGSWYYEQQLLGFNYRITDMQCALGISQMLRIDEFIERRREIVRRYNEAFRNLQEFVTPYEPAYSKSGYHLYVIRIKPEMLKADRKEIFEALRAENIGVNVHYIPVYYHPYYRDLGYEKGLCPEAEKLYEEIITLPLFPALTEQDIEDVIQAVYKVFAYYRR